MSEVFIIDSLLNQFVNILRANKRERERERERDHGQLTKLYKLKMYNMI